MGITLSHIRLWTSHEFKWLTFNSCCSKNCVAPNMKNIVIKEFQDEWEYCHSWNNPNEVVGVVVKIAILHNLGRKSKPQKNDKFNKEKDIKSCLTNECWYMKTRTLCIFLVVFCDFFLTGHLIHSQIVVKIDCGKWIHHRIVEKFQEFPFSVKNLNHKFNDGYEFVIAYLT